MVFAMPEMTPAEIKAAMKDAIKEWLDEKFADFGKWSFLGICAGALALLGWAMVWAYGSHK